MKYVWLVALLLLLGATWSMGSPNDVARLSDLADRQAEFAKLITDSIQAARPDVTGVDFQQLYVESVRAGEVLKAHFRYVIHEATAANESTDQTLEGTSLLTSEDSGLSWQVRKTAMTDSNIIFNEGAVITAQPAHDGSGVSEPETDLKQ